MRTSNDLPEKRVVSELTRLIKELKPEEPANPAMLKAVNEALRKLEVNAEVTEITRGQVWQFQDVYKYAYQCIWECLSYKTCKYKGLGAEAWVVNGKLEYRYVGCGRFVAFKRLVQWARDSKNSEALKAIRSKLKKDPEELSMEEWEFITESKFHNIIRGR